MCLALKGNPFLGKSVSEQQQQNNRKQKINKKTNNYFNVSFEDILSHSYGGRIASLRKSLAELCALGQLKFDYEQFISHIEHLLLFVEDVRSDSSTAHLACACARYVKTISGKSLSSMTSTLMTILRTDFILQSGDTNNLDLFVSYIQDAEAFTKSDFAQRTKRFLSTTISFSLANIFGFDLEDKLVLQRFSLLQPLVEKSGANSFDFWSQILTYSAYMYERGKIYMECGNITSFFGFESHLSSWSSRCDIVLTMGLHLNNPELAYEQGAVPAPFNAYTLKEDLDVLLSESLAYKESVKSCGFFERKLVQNYISKLKILQLDVIKEIQSFGDRPQPFGLLLVGESAQMKSWLSRWAFHIFSKVATDMGLHAPSSPEAHIYSKNPNEDFWTNFNSTKWCVLLDDIAATKSEKVSEVPSDMRDFLRVQNNVPFCPEQASLDKKGMTPMKNLLTLGTSNVEHLNVTHYFVHAYAQLRRWNILVKVELKPEYCVSGVLDKSKIPAHVSEYDMWVFTPYRPVPEKHGKVSFIYDTPITSFNEFTDFYVEKIKSHILEQSSATDALSQLKTVDTCPGCYRMMKDVCPKCDPIVVQGAKLSPLRVTNLEEPSFSVPSAITKCDTLYDYIGFFALLFLFICIRFVITPIHILLEQYSPLFGGFWLYRNIHVRVRKAEIVTTRWAIDFVYKKITRRVRTYIMRTSLIANILLVAVSIYGAYICANNLFKPNKNNQNKKENKKDNNEMELQGNIPTAFDERPKVWFNDDPSLHMSELSVDIRTTGNTSVDKFAEKLFPNIFYGVARMGDQGSPLQALCLGGHLYVTNKHHFDRNIDSISLGNFVSGSGVRPDRILPLQSIELMSIPGSDLMFMNIPDLPPCKDVTGHIQSKPLAVVCEGLSVKRQSTGFMKKYTLKNLTHRTLQHPAVTWSANKEFDAIFGSLTDMTMKGDCGMPLIAKLGDYGCAILGIHVGLNVHDKVSFSQVLLTEHIKAARDFFKMPFLVQAGVPELSLSGESVQLGPLHHKSPLLFCEDGSAKLYGSLPGFRQQAKSKVCKTVIHSSVLELSSETSLPHTTCHGPPVMKGYAPKRKALLDVLENTTNFNISVLKRCSDAFYNDIRSKLKEDDLSKYLEVYTDEVAVNGCAGVSYVDSIKRKTSAGYPWRKSKKFVLMDIDPLPFAPDAVTFTPEVWERVRKIEEKMKRCERSMPVFTAHLKDEPVSHRKIETKATRVFSGAPVDFSLVMRKYLLSFVRLVQNNRFAFEAGTGTVVQSGEWEEIFKYLTGHGSERIIAGDYAAFDKSMSGSVINEVFLIMRRLAEDSGNYTDEELNVISTLGEDIAFPFTDFFGDLVMFYGSNPSGHPLTVIVNGMVNSIYMRYCYSMLNPEKHCRDFQEFVALMTYGDDNILGVSSTISWFNHTTIQTFFSSIGIVYTMADKDEKSVPFISIWSATFLKRSFRFDPDVGRILCPLEFKSTNKTLLWGMKTPLSPKYYALIKMQDVLREFFYYGKSIFIERRNLYLQVARDCGLQDVCPIVKGTIQPLESFFSTYEEELETFRRHCRSLQ